MGSILTKEIDFEFLRRISGEKVAFCFCALWCALPLVMVFATVFFALSDPLVQQGLYVPYGLVNIDVRALYQRLFFVMGSFTIVYAALLIAANWKAICSRSNLRNNTWVFLLAALLVWATISTAISDNPTVEFKGGTYLCDGLFSYFIFGAILCVALRIQDERRKRILLRGFIAVVDVLSVIMLLEALEVPPIRLFFQTPYSAVFNNSNHFAYVLCITGLCAASMYLHETSKRAKAFHLASFALQVFTLLVNDTLGCYLAMIVGLVSIAVIWVKSGRKAEPRMIALLGVFLALSVLSAFGCFSSFAHGSLGGSISRLLFDVNAVVDDSPDAGRAGSGRMRLWVEALRVIPERPLFGFGPEGLLGEYSEKMGMGQPHNEIIQCAAFLGIPGLLLYLAALIMLAARQFRSLAQLSPVTLTAIAAVIGYFASSLFGVTVFNAAPYYWMMIGFAACSATSSQLFSKPADGEPLGGEDGTRTLSPFMGSVCVIGAAATAVALVALGFLV